MGKYKVFTPEMEYPEGMTEYQAGQIWWACELRTLADELEWFMREAEDDELSKAAMVKEGIEAGDFTLEEFFEAVVELLSLREVDLGDYFAKAAQRICR